MTELQESKTLGRILRKGGMRRAVFITVLMTLVQFVAQSTLVTGSFYDPEQQHDGIPIFSARGTPPDPLESINNDNWSTPNEVGSGSATKHAQRRQDPDLDDALEDEDEDDNYKSGSMNRESIENPSYGESQRASRDGDEIENFFDRHLGAPKQDSTTNGASEDESQHVPQLAEVPAIDPDDGDDFETAASGPIASFLHNLIFHHNESGSPSSLSTSTSTGSGKRPFVIHALEAAASAGKEKTEEIATAQNASNNRPAPPVANFLAQMVAAPSSMVAYEPELTSSNAVSDEQDPQASIATAPSSGVVGGVEEIYIGRRPTVMSYLQQAQASDEQQYLSAAQQLPTPYYSQPHLAAGSANVWRTPQLAAAYRQVPVAASHAYPSQLNHNQPSHSPEDGSGGEQENDEQTVTYGLSFGSRPNLMAGPEEEASGGEEQTNSDPQQEQVSPMMLRAQQQHYQQQVAGGYVPYSARYRTASSRNNVNSQNDRQAQYYQQHQQQPVLTPAQQQILLAQHYRRQALQQPRTQYTSDGSSAETMSRPAAYHRLPAEYRGQLRTMVTGPDQQYSRPSSSAMNRQRLLATLNEEIHSSPAYSATASQQRLRVNMSPVNSESRQPVTAFKSVRKSFLGDDLNSYNVFHAEVDPYKSLTTSARMVPDRTSLDSLSNSSSTAQRQNDDLSHGASSNPASPPRSSENRINSNLLTGPLSVYAAAGDELNPNEVGSEFSRNHANDHQQQQQKGNLRVRRDDSDDRDDAEDDGVWVDDDEDDDNRQQSSDLNETAQDPEDEEDDSNQDAADSAQASQINPPGVIGGPHGYELSPSDLMIYNG